MTKPLGLERMKGSKRSRTVPPPPEFMPPNLPLPRAPTPPPERSPGGGEHPQGNER